MLRALRTRLPLVLLLTALLLTVGAVTVAAKGVAVPGINHAPQDSGRGPIIDRAAEILGI